MREESKKISTRFESAAPRADLFDRIISAIKQEQELQNTRKLFFIFFALLIISFSAMPFSWTVLAKQVESSGFLYFLSSAISDFANIINFWQDFASAMLESLPITGITLFATNIVLALFTLRLFLHKKQLLFKYLMHNFKFSIIC